MNKIFTSVLFLLCFVWSLNAQPIAPDSTSLQVNKVKALVYNDGNNFWDMTGDAQYNVPNNLFTTTIFSLNPWISGYDSNGTLHFSGNFYAFSNSYLPGPIQNPLLLDDTITAAAYNTIWDINQALIDEFLAAWQSGAVSNGTYTIPNVIASWPGNHPANGEPLAPYIDVDTDGSYNPQNGDYPAIKGDQMLWFVYNDNTNRDSIQGIPLGLEFRVSFYAYSYPNPPSDSIDIINYTTFMDFEIVNQSGNDYNASTFSLLCDFDIGYAFDDYTGTMVNMNTLYGYNGDLVDGTGLPQHFGGSVPPPPAQGLTFLKAPLANENDLIDNDHDGTIDEAGEECLMTSSIAIINGITPTAHPETAEQKNQLMHTLWKDGARQIYGGDGYPYDSLFSYTPTSYSFPASSDPNGYGQNGQTMSPWSAITENLPSMDFAMVGNCGEFTLSAGEIIEVQTMLNFAWPDSGDIWSAVEELENNVAIIQHWHDTNNFPSGPTISIPSEDENQAVKLYPNPAGDVTLMTGQPAGSLVQIYNPAGQLLFETVSASESLQLQLKNYLPGSYIVKISNADSLYTLRLLKIE